MCENFQRNYFLAVNLYVPKRVCECMLTNDTADRRGCVRVHKKFQCAPCDGINRKHVKGRSLRIVRENGDECSIEELEEHASVAGDAPGTAHFILRVRSNMQQLAA